MNTPLSLARCLIAAVLPCFAHSAQAEWGGQLSDEGELVLVDMESGDRLAATDGDFSEIHDFAVSRDGQWIAVIATADVPSLDLARFHGPQLFFRNQSAAEWTLLTADHAGGAPAGARGPVLIAPNGDWIVFETGPVFPQNGRLSEELAHYHGPVLYDRAAGSFQALGREGVGGFDASAFTQALRYNENGELIVVTDEAAGAPADQLSLIARSPGGDETRLIGALPAGETLFGFTYWRENEAGFTAEALADPAVSGPNADPDRDKLVNRLEWLLGTSPLTFDRAPVAIVETGSGWAASFQRNAGLRPGALDFETTAGLSGSWDAVDVTGFGNPIRNGGRTVVWHSEPIPISADAPYFIRLRTTD